MQELKFRVWDKTANQMIYLDDDNTHHSFIFIQGNAEYINLRNGSGGDEYEIMQYTGLKDRNDKEIYKGDIIEIDGGGEPIKTEVGFEEGCFVVYPDWLEDTSCNWVELYKYCDFVEGTIDIKVIGNIHEEKIR